MRVTAIAFALAFVGCSEVNSQVKDNPQKKSENKQVKVYKSPAEFFDGLPKEIYPRMCDDGEPERVATRDWLKKNRLGHRIEWQNKVRDVSIREEPSGKFNVTVHLKSPEQDVLFFGNTVRLGNVECRIIVKMAAFGLPLVGYNYIDYETAKKMRTWKEREVIIACTVTDVNLKMSDRSVNYIFFVITASNPTIDGYKSASRDGNQ